MKNLPSFEHSGHKAQSCKPSESKLKVLDPTQFLSPHKKKFEARLAEVCDSPVVGRIYPFITLYIVDSSYMPLSTHTLNPWGYILSSGPM